MRFFPFIYLIVYSLMHGYIVIRVRSSLNFKSRTFAVLIILSLVMIAMPIFVRISSSLGLDFSVHELAYVSFLWMGFVFLFFCTLITYDFYKLLLKVCRYLFKMDLSFLILSPRVSFVSVLVLTIMLLIYGHFEANDVRIEKITISTPKIPEWSNKLRIVQISDVHIGPIVREKRLNKIIEIVKKADPDILVATGDIVDGQINNHPQLIEPFKEINPRYGKYSVAGNHEFYVGIDQSVDFMQKAGFRVLRGEGMTVEGLINIAGVDDPAVKNYSSSKVISENEVLSKLPKDKFTILLKHRPDIKADYIGLFDLQLSGHTHKGQIFPISLITMFYYQVHTGFAKLPNNSYLYVSRGSGTSGPPIRILSPPEVTVIDIVYEPQN